MLIKSIYLQKYHRPFVNISFFSSDVESIFLVVVVVRIVMVAIMLVMAVLVANDVGDYNGVVVLVTKVVLVVVMMNEKCH